MIPCPSCSLLVTDQALLLDRSFEDDHMALRGPAQRLTIFIGASDQCHHKPLYAEIVRRAHQTGLAGATVLRGIEGFGATSQIHVSRLLSLSQDLPVAVIIVDTPERIRNFLDELDSIVTEGALVILDEVEVVKYVAERDRKGRAVR